MDSGFVPADDTFEAEFDVCQTLSANKIIWTMDQILCLEAAWHEGYPLSQTVFTSLHIDRLLSPDNQAPYTFRYGQQASSDATQEAFLVHETMRAYCIGVIKCCQLVLQTIQSQNYYEEEDFVTHLFGRELLPKVDDNAAVRHLDGAIRSLSDTPLPADVREALQARLQFRRSYLTSLSGEEDRWAVLKRILNQLDHGHHLSHPVPDAFSDKVQRQLATSTPPRPMLVSSWKDACQQWTKMLEDVVEADRLTDFWLCQSPHCLQRATWAFTYRQPQPNTFARAYLQDLLFGSDRLAENVSHFDLLLTDIRDLVLAGDSLADPESFQIEVTSDPRHQASRHIEAFMDKAFDEYLNLYRMVCQNRCRIRRTFTQAIPILDGLEAEAKLADEGLDNFVKTKSLRDERGKHVELNPLTNWAKSYRLQIMAWTVQLGFETEVYLADELGTMYGLLAHFTRLRHRVLEHVERFAQDRLSGLTSGRPQPSSARYAAECRSSVKWLESLLVQADATISLSSALQRLCNLLSAIGGISTPKRDYAQNQQLLYDARMKPYLSMTHSLHEIPSLSDMIHAGSFTDGTIQSACSAIGADIKDARAALAKLKETSPEHGKYLGTEEKWRREIKQIETTCVAVSVQASQVLRIGETRGVKNVQVDVKAGWGILMDELEVTIAPPGKRYHDWWVVPQVKEKK